MTARHWEVFASASRRINAVLEVPIILRTLVTSSIELADASAGMAALWVDGEIAFTDYHQNGQWRPVNYRFKKGMGVTGHVMECLSAYYTNEASKDAVIPDDMRGELGIYNLVNVPLLGRNGQLLGCLEIHNTLDHRSFSDADLSMLRALAVTAAMALENVRQHMALQRAEEALRQSEATLIQSQRIGKVGSWEWNWTTGNLTWSAEMHRIFGRRPESFRPSSEAVYAAMHPSDREKVRRAVETAVRGEGKYNMDHRILLPDGTERVVHEQAEVIRDAGGVRLFGSTQDITERKHLEEQLRQAQKMEALGQLAGGVAHDFNNILTVIQGHIGLVMAAPRIPIGIKEHLDDLTKAAERASSLTRQLLMFGRRQTMQPRILDLNELVGNLGKMLQRLIGEHISLRFNYGSPGLTVMGDPGMLEQVLMNLAVNARDAMPDGGVLTIGTSMENITEHYTDSNPEAVAGAYACLSVVDSGCGIDQAVLKRIFEPFFTTKESGKGTGLGLATVYGIVKQHLGWIEVYSVVGEGSTFEVFLPIRKQIPTASPSTSAEPELRGGNETVLLVEDEPNLREVMTAILKRYGYRVIDTANGLEALGAWEQGHDSIQILVTDLIMPEGVNGRELAEQLVSRKKSLKVVYCSGYSESRVLAGLQLQEGLNYLPKPFHPRKLVQIVRACLDAK